MGRGRIVLKRTARPHSKGRKQPFLWDRENRTSSETSLQTARKVRVPEKEIRLMLFEPVWLQTPTLFSEQYVQLIAEQSTCTYNYRNVRYHKALNRDDNRRILRQITFFFLPNLCSYLLTEIHSSSCKSVLSDGLTEVLNSDGIKSF